MDTVLEIFRDHAHAVLPGFSGELGGTVVDLGANEGYYALRLKLLNPTIQVLAAEPVPENAEGFRENMATNGIDDVTLCETAITHQNGTTRIETLPHVGTVASTNMRAFPRPWIKPSEIRTRTVPTMTLEALLDNHSVTTAEILKVDVEGSEVDILTSSAAALRRFRRVVVECHGAAARQATRTIMESEGFATLHAEPKRSGDLYFLRQ
ncbi:MAG TPA: FkbM family methyltransferase [Alkalispirochaeta sp.]|nr:FkbM family methyltransferase [Alkalispirochaeta sp.]